MALLFIVLALTTSGALAGPSRETSPPSRCPPGWVEAKDPLNRELRCVNNTLTAGQGGSEHPGHCPLGWIQAPAALNDVLTCIANTLAPNPTPTPQPGFKATS